MATINIFPIKWFGDRNAYMKSLVKIITVGLNPSDKEFREKDGEPYSSSLRFPDYKVGDDVSLENALNSYFMKNPYRKWFNAGFEPLLNGMSASFYSCDAFKNRAIHTDICSPWATDPTWSKLSLSDRNALMKSGVPEWGNLIKALKPDIILFSIPQQYINMLHLNYKPNALCSFDKTEKGVLRKHPVEITMGEYNNTLAVFGRTWNLPYGALGKEQKEELGRKILAEYKKLIART